MCPLILWGSVSLPSRSGSGQNVFQGDFIVSAPTSPAGILKFENALAAVFRKYDKKGQKLKTYFTFLIILAEVRLRNQRFRAYRQP
ncbi:hypothetical protein DDV21_009950 [Streptococcus chenjunshii]|uniref:Uncharacterized protein n=1 Tax=Streptococcus chenjunshii TaxID=2173853 RepID=A0A372KMU5_9STRE|nr:hypothetical protein DDV21_009950 [Streptococcus chenjunshii]RFU50071.1 hypothetical protein DDV22_10540 [Streptococcus chenjunshii]RFU52898.1 hypothetical protein DDV23_07220 [Streptococcus chenjunshii]